MREHTLGGLAAVVAALVAAAGLALRPRRPKRPADPRRGGPLGGRRHSVARAARRGRGTRAPRTPAVPDGEGPAPRPGTGDAVLNLRVLTRMSFVREVDA